MYNCTVAESVLPRKKKNLMCASLFFLSKTSCKHAEYLGNFSIVRYLAALRLFLVLKLEFPKSLPVVFTFSVVVFFLPCSLVCLCPQLKNHPVLGYTGEEGFCCCFCTFCLVVAFSCSFCRFPPTGYCPLFCGAVFAF